jgi:large repetitive protein
MGLGDDGLRRGRQLAHGSGGETLLAAVIFAVALGFTWVNHGGNDSVELAAPSAQTGEKGTSTTIPPSQPAIAASFSKTGAIIRPAPSTARIIDPDTGEEVVVPLPPGATVVDGEVVPIGSTGTTRPGSTATTRPGTGTTGTTGAPTTSPPTTQPPTTQPPTTEPPTTEPPTTEPPTTEPPTTEPPTTQPPPPPAGGLLGGVVDLLGG